MKLQKYISELIGTFGLTLAVAASIAWEVPLATPIVAGLTLGLFVYILGGISGAHLNPAVTIALATVKKISWEEAVYYVIAQVLGAELAMTVPQWFTGTGLNLPVSNDPIIGVAEALGAFFLVFAVAGVVYGKVDDDASGITIGGSLLLGVMIAMGVSNGILNPAVAIGLGSISVMYLLGPIVGGILAIWLYRYLQRK